MPTVSDKDYDPESITEKMLLGDINMDGSINLFDLVMCLNHVAQKAILYGNALITADVNKDGNVNLYDLMNMLNDMENKENTVYHFDRLP